jgi:hypothetical protein
MNISPPRTSLASSRVGQCLCSAYAPDCVANVVGDEQRATLVDRDANWATHRFAALIQKARDDIDRRGCRFSILEWNENHLVATRRFSIPGTVLSD